MATLNRLSSSITCLLLLVASVTAWTSSSLAVDLGWPSIGHEGYITIDGQRVSPYADPAVFPCANVTIPADVQRIQFPLTGARLQFNLVNNSQPAAYNFLIDAYLGQFSSDTSPGKTGWSYMNTMSYSNITTGPSCTNPVNLTYEVDTTPSFDLTLQSTAAHDLIGVNLTLGLRMIMLDEIDNQEEMYQCSYLTIVHTHAPVTQSRGSCNPAPVVPSPTSTGLSSPSTNANAASSHAHHTATTVGIAVGVVVAVAALLVALGAVLLRRRRRSAPSPASSHDSWGTGKGDVAMEKRNSPILGGGDTSKQPAVETRGVHGLDDNDDHSIFSEPLPVRNKQFV